MLLTDIVRVEFIDTPNTQTCADPQQPRHDGTDNGVFTRVEVVDNGGVETDVGVNDQGDSEDSIEDGLE